ncbi:MAG: radical SAM protein [bacterium]
MKIRENIAKSILRKHKKIDSWFISRYGMNLYRGCTHNCAYCDGRAEGYYVDGEFGNEVTVKVNAPEILKRELDPKRKRKPLKQGFILVGGGVGDSYQPIEEEYELTRKALGIIYEHGFPVHMLTKSNLIKRDLDILKKINEQSKVIVSYSFSSVDDKVSSIFEPGVPPPSARLDALAFFKQHGIVCGMFLLPVIPFITDTLEKIEQAIKKANQLSLDFVIFGGMTLKSGKQKAHFTNVLKEYYPRLIPEYENLYTWDRWGNAKTEYYSSLHRAFHGIAKKYKIPRRIPISLYQELLSENDLVVIILEHIDYFLRSEGKTSPYGFAAYSISQLEKPLNAMTDSLKKLKGIGPTTERIILEILKTGTSSYYKTLAQD